MRPHPRLQPATSWACSSVVEHCVDIAGVASSILATPTIIRCDCNTQTGLAAIDGRACLLCGPEAPTFGRCRRSEEHTSELQSLMRHSYAVFCSKKKKQKTTTPH